MTLAFLSITFDLRPNSAGIRPATPFCIMRISNQALFVFVVNQAKIKQVSSDSFQNYRVGGWTIPGEN